MKYSDGEIAQYGFHFNELDTVPYWFGPLKRVFESSRTNIAQRATEWICDRWGRSDQDAYAYNDSRRSRNEHQWQLMDNGHGSSSYFGNAEYIP